MSHVGRRGGRIVRRVLSETGFPDLRPKVILKEEISSDAILDGDRVVGEFDGNGGDTVLVGLSTASVIDPVNVLNDNEKGVIVGHTEYTTYYSVFHNDGAGPKVIYQIPDRFKDDEHHTFEIKIKPNNTVFINFDGHGHTLTTKIPQLSDSNTLKLVNYGSY